MSGRLARFLTGSAVAAVAGVAAYVSFTHIQSIALAHGQPLWDARLLPVSVDGLIVVSSLTLLTEARAHRPAPRLARLGLALGVIATVAANVAFGARYGAVGAVISAWPAAAFVTATEILVGQLRRAGSTPALDDPVEAVSGTAVAAVVDAPVAGIPTVPAPRARTVSPKRAPQRASRSPEKIFSGEIEAGQLPSIRRVKQTLHVGTDRARVILADLETAMLERAVTEVSEAA